MSELSRDARRALRAKAHRLANQKVGSVDSSSYGPEETLHADIKTGMRPVSRQAYKAGGAVKGDDTKANAGKKPRASGGKALANAIVNRDDKDANQEREGYKFDGGMKSGGRAKRAAGGEVPTSRFSFSPVTGSRATQAAGLKQGGRAAKSVGGTLAAAGMGGLTGLGISELAKRKPRKRGGKVDVNIVIATGKPDATAPPMGASPLRPPVVPPPAGAAPMPAGLGAGAPPMGPPPGAPPGMPPMPRKRGGPVMHGGGGSGVGRLDKIGIHKYDP